MLRETLDGIAAAAHEAECVLIGAGNGMDMAEGLDIFRPSRHFVDTYGDLAQRYGAMSVLQGVCGLPRGSEAQWEFARRFAQVEWIGYEPSDAMQALARIAGDKDYFILTYNFNGRFARAGFDEHRLLETEGSVRSLICTKRCSSELYPSQGLLSAAGDLPTCPRCGSSLELSVREDRLLAPDAECEIQIEEYKRFAERTQGRKTLVLELGIGPCNRSVKGPLAELAYGNPDATYVAFNYDCPQLPCGVEERGYRVSGDLGSALIEIAAAL